jgi:hypothetical protein
MMVFGMRSLYVALLWPAGFCPSLSLRAFVTRKAKSLAFCPLRGPLLTPLKGEMAGRPEGGAKELNLSRRAP